MSLRAFLLTLLAADFFVWFWLIGSPSLAQEEIYFLDVGQGDASLIRLPPDVSVLLDGGPPGSALARALDGLLPIKRLDLILISHAQDDHFGGLLNILDSYSIGAILWNGGAVENNSLWAELRQKSAARGTPWIAIRAGDKISLPGGSIRILSPTEMLAQSAEPNDGSLVALASTTALRVLFTGDIGQATERALVGAAPGGVHVLKVAHHGSRYSSAPEFVEYYRPQLAVIEVGVNRYGHPAPETLRLFSELAIPLLRTDESGAIRLLPQADKLEIFSAK